MGGAHAFQRIVRFLAALAMAAGGLYFAAQGWRFVPPAREALSEFRVAPRDFGVVVERSGAARGHGGGTCPTDSVVVDAPGRGRVELRPPHRIVLRYFGGIRNDAPLIMLADSSAWLIYQVAGDNAVYLGYDEASAIARQNAMIAFGFAAFLVFGAAATGRSVLRQAKVI